MAESEFNSIFSENLKYFLSYRGKSQADLARFLDVSTAAVNTWCKGLKAPRMDKIDRICQFLMINRSDLLEKRDTNNPPTTIPSHYLDEDVARYADFLHKNPDYKVLFDASCKIKPEDLDFVRQMIERTSSND